MCPRACPGRFSGWYAWLGDKAEACGESRKCPLGAPFCSPWDPKTVCAVKTECQSVTATSPIVRADSRCNHPEQLETALRSS